MGEENNEKKTATPMWNPTKDKAVAMEIRIINTGTIYWIHWEI